MIFLTCKEKGRVFEVKIPRNFKGKKLRIDDGIISSQTVKKCDFSILVDKDNKKIAIFFIEFKGMDLKDAIPQLESTICQLKKHPIFKEYYDASIKIREAHAVCSKILTYPQTDTVFQNAVLIFKKKYGFTLKRHSEKGSITISSKILDE